MNISEDGVRVLREREGCELEAYYDSVGVCTIGVGHTAAAGEPIPEMGMSLTQEEADNLLESDLVAYEDCVNSVVTQSMTQPEYDAFVSICFNIGQGAFVSATFVERFNAGDHDGCAEAILWWDTPGEILPRRQGEYVQFLGGYIPRVKEIGS